MMGLRQINWSYNIQVFVVYGGTHTKYRGVITIIDLEWNYNAAV